jgi:hypothetical protein
MSFYVLMKSLNLSLIFCKRVILPNPIEEIPVEIVSVTPSFTLTAKDWTNLLSSFILKKKKRQQTSTGGALNADALFALCPLNDALNPELPAGCIAGLYLKYCLEVDTYGKLAECQKMHDQVFGASIFSSVGKVCPAWKNGPRSLKCKSTLKTFKVDLGYMTVTSEHASNLTFVIFGSTKFAPSYDINDIKCRWEEEEEPLPSPTVPDGVGYSIPTTFFSASLSSLPTTTVTNQLDANREGRVDLALVFSAIGGIGAITLASFLIGYYKPSWFSVFKDHPTSPQTYVVSRRSSKNQQDEEKFQEEQESSTDEKLHQTVKKSGIQTKWEGKREENGNEPRFEDTNWWTS